MDKIIARNKEKAELQDIFCSSRAELVAIFGRRRVGKTYLVKIFLKTRVVCFCVFLE